MDSYFEKNCREANAGRLENFVLLDHTTTDSAFLHIRTDAPYSMQGGVAVASYLDDKGVRHALVSTGSHTVLVGSTGSGKTQGFYLPQIELIGRSTDNVSFLAMDMKGVMYREKADFLRKHGFKVVALNGKDPFFSSRFNPMKAIYRAFQNAHDAERLVEQAKFGLREYEFRGKKLTSYYDWKAEVEAYANEELELSEQLMRLMVETLVPIESKKDTSWEQGAREIVVSVMQMMLEDSLYPERGMTEEKFNLYNLSLRVSDRSDDYHILRKMLAMRGPTSPAKKLNNYVESAAKQTRDSFMMTAGDKMCRIVNQTMNVMSTGSEVDVNEIVDSIGKDRIAIFCVADSSNKAAYALCNLFLVELVTMLQRRGDDTTEGDFHIFADEFCNMLPMPGIVDWITTMRSRRVWFHLGLQSFDQMDYHYDEKVRKTVVGNSKTIFMGSNEYKTLEEFGKSMGETVGVRNNFSMSNDGSVHMSSDAINVPLVRVSDLAALKLGEAYVRVFGPYGNKLLKTVLEPNFQCADFAHDNATFERRNNGSFCPELVYYDVEKIDDSSWDDSYFQRRSQGKSDGERIAALLTKKELAYVKKITQDRTMDEVNALIRDDEKILYFRPHLVGIGFLAHGFSVRLGVTKEAYDALMYEIHHVEMTFEEPETDDLIDHIDDFEFPDLERPTPDETRKEFRDFFKTLTGKDEGQISSMIRKGLRIRSFSGGHMISLPMRDGNVEIALDGKGPLPEASDLGMTFAHCDRAFVCNTAYTQKNVQKILDRYGVTTQKMKDGKALVKRFTGKDTFVRDLLALYECIGVLRSFDLFAPTPKKKK